MLAFGNSDHHKMKKYKNFSQNLRDFSWSLKTEKTKEETLIQNTVLEWYDAKHRNESESEINFINNIPIDNCPFCSNNSIIKNGFTKEGVQRYKCKNCNRRFNPLTGTIFDSKKIPISEWFEFLIHLFQFHSIKSSAFDNRNAITTTQYWLKKVFAVLKDIQSEVVLEGTVFIDETFFSVRKSEKTYINGKEPRGIFNKKCILTGCSDNGNFCISTDSNKLSFKRAREIYVPHISSNAFLIHDEELAHEIIVNELNLKHKTYNSKAVKKLSDEQNPLTPINDYHSLLKKFLKAHNIIKTENLQDWLNLFWFITNTPKNKYDKILSFLKLSLVKKKVIRYRCKT